MAGGVDIDPEFGACDVSQGTDEGDALVADCSVSWSCEGRVCGVPWHRCSHGTQPGVCACVCVARMLLTLPLPGILWVSLWFAPPAVAYSFGDYALLAAGTINFTYFAAIMTTLLMVRAVRYKLNLWVDGVLEVGSCVCGCVAVWWCQIGQVDYRRRKVLFQMFNRLIESRSVVKTDAEGNPYAIAVPPLVPLSVTHNIRQLIEARTLVKVQCACVCVCACAACTWS